MNTSFIVWYNDDEYCGGEKSFMNTLISVLQSLLNGVSFTHLTVKIDSETKNHGMTANSSPWQPSPGGS